MEPLLIKLDRLITDNLSNLSFDVNELARLVYMSRPTLYRKTQERSPLTPHEMITRARMQKAAELLSSGEYTVNEVTAMVGYHSRSNFGKAFLRQFHLSPVEYRKTHRAPPAASARNWQGSTRRYSSTD